MGDLWIVERIIKILWMVSLFVAAIQDFKERQVSVPLLLVGAGTGILGVCLMTGEEYRKWMETGINAERVNLLVKLVEMQVVRIGKAAGIGVMLLILAKLTRGAIGGGDGLFFLMSACYWDWKCLMILFLGALAVSSVWGMILLMKRQWSRDGIHAGKMMETIPFLTCCLVPGVCLVWKALRQ